MRIQTTGTHRELHAGARRSEGRRVALVDDHTEPTQTRGGVTRVGDVRDGRSSGV